jgi:hypothetical protein
VNSRTIKRIAAAAARTAVMRMRGKGFGLLVVGAATAASIGGATARVPH